MLQIMMKYWIEFFLTAITTGIIYIFKQYNGLKNGMIALLRNEIVRDYENCTLLGYCPSYMKENIQNMYENYHKLGGNGMVTALVKEIYKMPNEKNIVKGIKNERHTNKS